MRYNYPPEWATMTPLEKDEFHRHMGAFVRRARFLLFAWARDPRWKRRWWDGARWREHGESDAPETV